MTSNILAAIDIGSNAIRLLISNVEYDGKNKDFRKMAFLRVPIRLGEDVFTEGKITEEKGVRFREAMQGFSHIMKAYNVQSYRACATSAMRDAKNGLDITTGILKNSGINIEIISGQAEAEYIYNAGGLDSVVDKSQSYLYVDVGGGSTEVIVYSGGHKVDAHSFQLGTVRMLTGMVEDRELDFFRKWLKGIYKKYAPLSVIASGGNINKVHKMLGKRDRETIKYTELKVLFDTLSDMTYEERIQNFKLNPYRADVIIPALKIFLTIGKVCKINEMYVPKVGLVDGIIHQLSEGIQ
ncbi:MAG: hypothetical protein ACK5MK_02815 [Dysgonomonas sp.]